MGFSRAFRACMHFGGAPRKFVRPILRFWFFQNRGHPRALGGAGGRARRRVVVLSARLYNIYIHTRPKVAWGLPPGAYSARAGSRTILLPLKGNRGGKGLSIIIARIYCGTRDTDLQLQTKCVVNPQSESQDYTPSRYWVPYWRVCQRSAVAHVPHAARTRLPRRWSTSPIVSAHRTPSPASTQPRASAGAERVVQVESSCGESQGWLTFGAPSRHGGPLRVRGVAPVG